MAEGMERQRFDEYLGTEMSIYSILAAMLSEHCLRGDCNRGKPAMAWLP
jgi:hypothetical protein